MGVAGAEALLSLIKQKQDLQGYRERLKGRLIFARGDTKAR